ncbi:uncharacterized protein METZ01_LOCUS165628 [marine metagenome]|uniref:Uncharacterized protein n=1 Tax=marine metagenome TaxID=408172 RepID=A0A382BGJ3_9ZZZZ
MKLFLYIVALIFIIGALLLAILYRLQDDKD